MQSAQRCLSWIRLVIALAPPQSADPVGVDPVAVAAASAPGRMFAASKFYVENHQHTKGAHRC
jgi:hypothetical protein